MGARHGETRNPTARHHSWRERFFKSTRGRVVRALCEGKRTVTELAEALGLTDNAIRAHLAALERDGLVEHVGTLPATRKPNFAYELTPAGHQFFPKVHGALLNEFLTAIRNQKGRTGLEKLIRQVGSGLMEKLFPGIRAVPPEARIVRVLDALETSGLLAGVEHGPDYLLVRGCSCPISEVVSGHPEVCKIAAKLLAKTLGREVKDRCDRSVSPRCVFQIAAEPRIKK